MNKNHHKSLRALDALLADDADLSVEDLRAELEEQGVDVEKFLERFSKTVRQGYQQRIRLEADASSENARSQEDALFGNLALKSKAELLAIRDQVINGLFGVVLQNTAMARCRNHQGEDISEEELRSWLEDLSSSTSEE